MQKQPGATQDLKLLADFIAGMAVAGMQFFQLAGEGVKFYFDNGNRFAGSFRKKN